LLAALDDYQRAVGLAFQVVDDVLDVTTDAATLGKTPGKDAQDHKPTYVSLLGLEAARALAEELGQRARAALAPLGPRAAYLDALADMVVHRVR
jgi:farnesyl diphosphate synthase